LGCVPIPLMNDSRDVSPDAPDVTIRTIDEPAQLARTIELFHEIWGSPKPMVTVELLRAINHAGGFTAAAYVDDEMVGASFGFLGMHRDEPALHSHVTGVTSKLRSSGIGQAMKRRQRAWAAERGLRWVTWTFDPLVRANAWFNLEVLGATVDEYLVDFYGPLDDEINAADETDRILVAWPTRRDLTPIAMPRLDGELTLIETPHDIVELRRSDPAMAQQWRTRVRQELGERLAAGATVIGFTRTGEYRLLPGATPKPAS